MSLVPDFESKLLLDILDRLPLDEQRQLRSVIRQRAAMVRAGVMRCPTWFQEELNAIDSRLRAWWDAVNQRWIIDRLQDEGIVERLRRMSEDGVLDARGEATGLLANGPFYLTILQFTPTPELQLDRQLLKMLQKCDMQRFESPSAYLAKQREAAERTQRANDQAATDKVAEAVDSLSSKQIEEFIAVETAIATGETITAHGSSASYLERAQQERRQFLKKAEAEGRPLVLDDPRAALNPGMHPRIYKRRRRA